MRRFVYIAILIGAAVAALFFAGCTKPSKLDTAVNGTTTTTIKTTTITMTTAMWRCNRWRCGSKALLIARRWNACCAPRSIARTSCA